MIGIGVDVVDVERFRRSLERTPSMRERLFTRVELDYVAPKADPVPSLAARFAAREAVMKALDLGLGAFGFHEAWVDVEPSGAPQAACWSGGPGSWRSTAASPGGCCRSAMTVPSPSPWSPPADRNHPGSVRLVIPIVTPVEMAAIDAAAPEPVDVLIERAGSAVAWAARRMMGGTYGRVVHVIVGPGNNGNDGRVAARRLARVGCAGPPARCRHRGRHADAGRPRDRRRLRHRLPRHLEIRPTWRGRRCSPSTSRAGSTD